VAPTAQNKNSGPCNGFNCLGHFTNVYDDDDDDKQASHVGTRANVYIVLTECEVIGRSHGELIMRCEAIVEIDGRFWKFLFPARSLW